MLDDEVHFGARLAAPGRQPVEERMHRLCDLGESEAFQGGEREEVEAGGDSGQGELGPCEAGGCVVERDGGAPVAAPGPSPRPARSVRT